MWSGAALSLCRERFYLGPVLGHCLLPAFSHVLVGEEARLDVTFQLLIFFGSTEGDEKEVPHKEELSCEAVHPWEPMGSVAVASASIT